MNIPRVLSIIIYHCMYTSVFTYIFTYLGCKKFFSISGEIRYLPQTTKLMTYQLEYIYWKTLIMKKKEKNYKYLF